MQAIIHALLAVLASFDAAGRFPSVGHDAAWALLPRENPPLPAWARVLIKPLPRTTGAMLELDRFHRVENPLGPVMAAKLRWIAADTIGCEYARATALFDLKASQISDEELRRLTERRPLPDEKGLVAFARQVTKAAYAVTDDEFAALLKQFGPEKITAVVHTLAFANFHNRIILALGVKVEPDGPCPPLSVKLDGKRRAEIPTPRRPAWQQAVAAKPAKQFDAPTDWKDVSFAELEQRLDEQKARSPRVPIPDASRFRKTPCGRQTADREDRLDAGQRRLPANDDAPLVRQPAGIPARVADGPTFWPDHFLGGDARQRLLLLNGPRQHAARGRGLEGR